MYKYHRIRIAKGVTRDEHRLIMEERLGRKLTFNEIVHHDNEKQKDNEPNNLKLMSRSEHTRMHMTGKKLKLETREKLSLIHMGIPKFQIAKYTKDQVVSWYIMRLNGLTLRQIENATGVKHSIICNALNGRTLAYRQIIEQIKRYT
jgi:hypothetical protein